MFVCLYVCLCVCSKMCVSICAHVCAYVGSPEDNRWYYCTGAIHLILFDAGPLAGLELTEQVTLVGWPVIPRDPSISVSPAVGCLANATKPVFFYMGSGDKTVSCKASTLQTELSVSHLPMLFYIPSFPSQVLIRNINQVNRSTSK